MAPKKRTSKKGSTSSSTTAALFSDPISAPTFGQGSARSYLLTDKFFTSSSARKLASIEYILLAGLLAASVYIRCTSLLEPNSVVFDEVHFGGFAKNYIRGDYFMDVHPPLAKMLFAAVGSLAGFKGDFDFEKIGDKFPVDEGAYYYWMRFFPAILGVGTILLCYLTLRLSGCRPIVCLITAGLLAIENAQITLSRYILLDSPLMFFIAASIYAMKKFEVQKPFSWGWYKALIACGISLGLALSSKWVGLFTVAWCGLCCVYQLWLIVGDLSVSPVKIAHHFVARGTLLLGIPITLYLAFFAVHFKVLVNEGDGGPFMSPAFRSTLNGNVIPKDITAQVGLGSVVSIRHVETLGGYLHSHAHFYPTGSKQQQITLYPHLDENNNWLIEPYNDTISETEFVPLTDGMKIRLRHVVTGRRLHSHDEKAPVSERDWQKEASCYGYDGFTGDANDDFIVEVVTQKTPEHAQTNVRAIETVFRLRHAMTGHYLFSSPVKLPDWGFEQQEVTTASQGARPLTHWYIETNENTRLSNETKEIINYKVPTLLDKVFESHKRMWNINNSLTEHHNWQSDPTEWPFLLRGINYWVREHKQIYLMGNAVIWWLSTFCILAFVVNVGVLVLHWQIGFYDVKGSSKEVFNFNIQTFSYVLGWLLHYAPFYIMGRQLFLHHYIPAAYFGILTLGHFFEIFVGYFSNLGKGKGIKFLSWSMISVIITLSLAFYIQFSPLIYGSVWTRSQCEASKALTGWDFDCSAFHKDYQSYENVLGDNSQSAATSAEPVREHDLKEAKETPQEVREVVQEQEEAAAPSSDQAEDSAPIKEEPESIVPQFEPDNETSQVNSKAESVEEVIVNESQEAAEEAAVESKEAEEAVEPKFEEAVETVVETVIKTQIETVVVQPDENNNDSDSESDSDDDE